MRTTDTLVIGAGQAGLAMSRCLTERGDDHVVLERGRVAERWRTERWDSLRLLTPNWMSRLPGWAYRGPDPGRLHDRRRRSPPTSPTTRRRSTRRSSRTAPSAASRRDGDGFEVTHRRDDVARRATSSSPPAGATSPPCPRSPPALDPAITRSRPARYRNPGGLPDGGVLVVGASATGVQLADELRRDRAGRRARGRPPQPDAAALPRHGHLLVARRASAASTGPSTRWPTRPPARREPSLQLVGRPDDADLDLATLAAPRRPLAGRLIGVDGSARPLRRRPRRDRRRRATSGCAGCSAAIDAHIDAVRPGARGARP